MVGLILMSLVAYVPYEVWWPMFQYDPLNTSAFPCYKLTGPGLDSFYIKWQKDYWWDMGGQPAIADVDGDGAGDVIFGTKHCVVVLNGLNGDTIWTSRGDAEGSGAIGGEAPAIWDVDDDGELEVVAAGDAKSYPWLLNSRTGHLKKGGIRNPECSSSPATLVDVDDDNKIDIVSGAFALNGSDLSEKWEYTLDYFGGEKVILATAVGDINNDGVLEAVLGTQKVGPGIHRVHAVDARTGNVIWVNDAIGEPFSSPTIADVDGDGKLDVVMATIYYPNKRVYVLDGENGSVKWSHIITGSSDGCNAEYTAGLAVGDVDGDGGVEIITSVVWGLPGNEPKDSVGFVCISGNSGVEEWHFKAENLRFQGVSYPVLTCTPTLVDLDNDGILEIVLGDNNSNCYLVKGDGSLIWKHHFHVPHPPYDDGYHVVIHGHAVGDVDGDGCLEIVGVSGG
ncbi:MAG: VCBS repeat-containing protein [Candidatus Stahlbacteria bacterium]|nr:VCBS repeat-containing protein [Candidatus Stahlbacteria bacterium]